MRSTSGSAKRIGSRSAKRVAGGFVKRIGCNARSIAPLSATELLDQEISEDADVRGQHVRLRINQPKCVSVIHFEVGQDSHEVSVSAKVLEAANRTFPLASLLSNPRPHGDHSIVFTADNATFAFLAVGGAAWSSSLACRSGRPSWQTAVGREFPSARGAHEFRRLRHAIDGVLWSPRRNTAFA